MTAKKPSKKAEQQTPADADVVHVDVNMPMSEPEPEPEPIDPVLLAKMQGRDAPLTDQIYGIEQPVKRLATDVLPQSTGQTQGVEDPLQLFINLYQPGELVSQAVFRRQLLAVLEDWRLRDRD